MKYPASHLATSGYIMFELYCAVEKSIVVDVPWNPLSIDWIDGVPWPYTNLLFATAVATTIIC